MVCVFGDAALTNGISYEALNNIAHTTKRFIGILNDNEWSIAKNVGAISAYLNKVITHPRYNRWSKDFERFVRRLPKGELALKLAHKAEEGFKGAVAGVGLQPSGSTPDSDGRGGYGNSLIFEEMGLRYLGPIDGHDLPMLINLLEFAKNYDRPIVLHVLTKKGKGYDAAVQVSGKVPRPRPLRHRHRQIPFRQARHAAELSGRVRARRWSSSASRTTRSSASPPRCPAAPA